MAVYKASFCYPFHNSIDPRVTYNTYAYKSDIENTDYTSNLFKCKVDTSNTKVTGYKIRILDQNNNVIFEPMYISPIQELEVLTKELTKVGLNVNTGYNGSLLYLPVFQCSGLRYTRPRNNGNNYDVEYSPSINASCNSIYFNARYAAKFYIGPLDRSLWELEEGSSEALDLVKSKAWDGHINGTIALVGDTVFIAPQDETDRMGGIWCVQSLDGACILKRSYNAKETIITTAEIKNTFVLITCPMYHGTVISCFPGWDEGQKPKFVPFINVDGTPIGEGGEGINFDISSYKWEITLYQGESLVDVGLRTKTSSATGLEYQYITYDHLDPQYYDIILNSGTILGSTNKRIQIANFNNPFDLSPSIPTIKVPQGTNNNPLVLQGRFMQLYQTITEGGSNYDTAISNRASVVSYDSTNGHVYPQSGIFSIQDILDPQVTKVKFFKHSNNPEYILAGERVNLATTGEEKDPIILYGDDPKTGTGLPIIDGVQVKNGDYVLIKNQANAQENGIYIATDAGYWTRSGAYNTWGKFIGAIVYVQDGRENGGKNFESTAQPGGTLYTKKSDEKNGYSQLYFTPEKPIILFDEDIKQTFDAYRDAMGNNDTDIVEGLNEYTDSTGDTKCMSDGITPYVGQTILYRQSQGTLYALFKCTGFNRKVTADSYNLKVTWSTIGTYDSTAIYKILNGKKYGGELTKGGVVTNALTEAYILKNTENITYISPYSNLDLNMMLKLKYNKWTLRKGSKDLTDITTNIFKITKVNKTVSAVHLDTIDADNDNPHTFVSPMPSIEYDEASAGAPFKYDIKSFYRKSDENPFWVIEDPYLDLEQGVDNLIPLKVDGEGGEEAYFTVTNGPTYKIKQWGDPSNWKSRYVSIKAIYRQFQEGNWESYRLTLRDQQGRILQDTGTHYDKDIKATFYGLTNNYNRFSHGFEKKTYIVTCEVSDTYHNTINLELSYTMNSNASIIHPIGEIYNGAFDCQTHSIVIEAEDPVSLATEYISVYRREYIELFQAKNPGRVRIVAGPWHCVAAAIPRKGAHAVRRIRDYNIKSGYSYQYVVYPFGSSLTEFEDEEALFEQMVNIVPGTEPRPAESGESMLGTGFGRPIKTHFNEWSITELIPTAIDLADNIPLVEAMYKVDYDNVWLLKFALEPGTQNQNINRSETTTLGAHPRIGYSNNNYISGDVTALLGSEILPSRLNKTSYFERLRSTIKNASTANEKAELLAAWRKFVFSKNPKLLKDMKGQSWIVQIVSSSNTPKNSYVNQPDSITFSWRQIGTTENIMAYSTEKGNDDKVPLMGVCGTEWQEYTKDTYDYFVSYAHPDEITPEDTGNTASQDAYENTYNVDYTID